MTPADWTLVLLLAAFLFGLCWFRSRTRLFWADELYGARVVGDPSFRHMLTGWRDGADGGGLVYYLLARLWTRLFGLNELTFRLFSTAGMAAAVVFVWAAVRRYTSTLIVALSVGIVFLTPAVMLWQEVNARFYGLFLASAALASLFFLVTAERTPTRSDLLLTACAHTCLVGSHILGLVYSFSLIAGMFLLDRLERRTRWPLYLTAGSGWLLLPLSYQAIRSSASVAQGSFWTRKPGPLQLLLGWSVFGKTTLWLLLVLAFLVLLRTWILRKAPRPAPWQSQHRSVLFLIASLCLAQLILYAKSQVGVSIYSDRYLLPVSIATVFALAWCLARLLPRSTAALPPTISFSLAAVALLPLCLFAYRRVSYPYLYPAPGYPQRASAAIPPGAPVLASIPAFTLFANYDPAHRYLFLLD